MPSRLRSAPLAALLLASCSYSSQYVPPVDGRARVVWRDGNPAALVPASVCRDQAFAQAALPARPQSQTQATVFVESESHVHHAVWIDLPVYVHHHHHFAGAPHATHLAAPASGPVHHALPANAPSSSGGGSSGGGSSSGNGGGELWVVAAVAGLVVMPAIAVGLAASEPEDAVVAAGSIDLVNAYNDLARAPGSACPTIDSAQPEPSPAAAVAPASEVSP